MHWNTLEINSSLALPFPLIDIREPQRHFTFQFLEFDGNQSDFSVKMGGVTGRFGIEYACEGLNCSFPCDITIGNVYEFYQALRTCYDQINGIAVLEDYSRERTKLTIEFDRHGHCEINAAFHNGADHYQSSVGFHLVNDQTCIPPILAAFQKFFAELSNIQGSDEFLY